MIQYKTNLKLEDLKPWLFNFGKMSSSRYNNKKTYYTTVYITTEHVKVECDSKSIVYKNYI